MTRGEYGYELKYTQTPSRSDRSTFTPSIYKLSRPEKPQKDFSVPDLLPISLPLICTPRTSSKHGSTKALDITANTMSTKGINGGATDTQYPQTISEENKK
ncbi:hypothetical protein TWF225_006001 [Orbilia oligospora]|nr:hypothetical protein TWF751_000398 [Orbilia oligospora]KAF3184323.1 hypothetical protein TWF225_006001 [Orbilia oligospora]KAF3253418.1 hypothetical protein TWF128_006500 [Orbilia oligospora]KAF3263342.1 hypothetical protein TWF217_003752 [Orbilia oligospora]KAF3295006.1 hypothetical protein TWF132_002337 [Orbilia oligospora]